MNQSLESATICTAMVAKFYGCQADVGFLLEKMRNSSFQETDVEAAFQQLAESVGLTVKQHQVAGNSFSEWPLPAICLETTGNWFVLARVEGDRFLVHRHDSSIPTVLEVHQFLACYAGQVVFAKPEESQHDKQITFSLNWLLGILFKNRKIFSEIALASIVLQIIGLVFPLFFQVVMDKVITHNSLPTLNVVALGLIVVTVFEILIGFSRTFIFSRVVNKIDAEVSSNIYTHLLNLPIRYFESRRVGDIVSRVKEIEGLRSFLTGQAFSAVLDLVFSFVFFCVLFYYSVSLTVLVIFSFILYFAFVKLIGPFIRVGLNEKYESASDSYSFLVESVSGIQTVKSLCLERRFGKEWDVKVTKNLAASFHVSLLASLGQQGIQFINKTLTIIILYFGAKEVIAGNLSVGQLVAFNMLSGQLTMPVLRIVQAILDYQQFSVSVSKIADIFSCPKETSGSNSKLAIVQGGLVFRQVSFRYPASEKTVLTKLDLDIRPGEIVGITGRSGSGKSTLYKLLQRLYSIESGQILLDGVDVRNFDINWLRQQVGVVMQEGFLFNRTIRENISLSNPGCSMDIVIRVAKLSGADEFISSLPEGYETVVEEGGANFSGGQKQRLAIARALLTNPKILIFDEATSALDYESEALIQENMKDICHGRTVIIIAHRLNTLKVANKIFVIENGHIVESGSYADMVKSNCSYFNQMIS